MKKTNLFCICTILLSLAFASCSQSGDATMGQMQGKIANSQSVQDLTKELKSYDLQFSKTDTPAFQGAVRTPRITYSKGDIVKIAISDVKGGIRGAGGGAGGVIVGAATASLIKFGTITVKKLLWGYFRDNYLRPKVYRSNSTCQYADSVGYYHNELEYAMYNADRNSYSKPSVQLVAEANARLLTLSSGFSRDGGLTAAEQLAMAADIDAIRNADESLSFTDYCDRLKESNPGDSEYIDYCAEYIYTAVYANLADLDGYTDSVIHQIQHSNAAAQDKQTLYRGIQIAYASILYSQNMKFNNIINN